MVPVIKTKLRSMGVRSASNTNDARLVKKLEKNSIIKLLRLLYWSKNKQLTKISATNKTIQLIDR
jgi:hypothetical protein